MSTTHLKGFFTSLNLSLQNLKNSIIKLRLIQPYILNIHLKKN